MSSDFLEMIFSLISRVLWDNIIISAVYRSIIVLDACHALGRQHITRCNMHAMHDVHFYAYYALLCMLKKNLKASKPSEHPPQVEECLTMLAQELR